MTQHSPQIGSAFLNGTSTLGEIRNLRVAATSLGSSLSFAHTGVSPTSKDLRVAVAVNGAPIAVLNAGEEQTGIPLLSDGYNTLDVKILHPFCSSLPSFYGQAYGRRAYLAWTAPGDANVSHVFSSTNNVSFTLATETTESEWSSPVLSEGLHYFKVRSLDAAGNPSANTAPVAVSILYRSEPVSNLTGDWNGAAIALSWTLPTDADRVGVDIFSNQNLATGNLESSIIENEPWEVKAANATSHIFTPSELGTWRFYVRPRDVDGRNDDSVEMVVLDASSIASGVEMNVPTYLRAKAIAGGKIRLTWLYDWVDGEDCVRFDFFRGNSEALCLASSTFANVAASATFGSAELSHTFAETFTVNTWFAIQSSTGSVNSDFSEVAFCTPDGSAPSAPSITKAIGN